MFNPFNSKVREQLRAGAIIVDVRTRDEYAEGHYPKAINIPVNMLTSRLGELGAKDSSIVVYCASGARSSLAQSILKDNGFTNVANGGGLASMPKPE
jgi:phage shock protein E